MISVRVTFVERDGSERLVKAHEGQDLLTLAHQNDIDLEGRPSKLAIAIMLSRSM